MRESIPREPLAEAARTAEYRSPASDTPPDELGDLSAAELAGLLRADQRKRWRRGERRRVETYLADFPALQADGESLLDLIGNEILLREEDGETPALAEFLQRFPTLQEPLRRQFELHAMLGGDGLPSGTIAVRPRSKRSDAKPSESTFDLITEALPASAIGIPGYEVLEELGRGGMGVVYKARHTQLNRLVALKMILSGGHAGSEERTRFRLEAEAVAQLQHPNIVQIYEIGEHDGRPFFSLEFIDGGSLDQHLDGNPRPPRCSAQLLATLAGAVHAAHQRNIIHRDLKPGNILLKMAVQDASDHGQYILDPNACMLPKITDFGLAKRLDGSKGQTQTGSVVGTPAYMAPEQASGRVREVGPASDIYALGTILYEMLTGRPPFIGENPTEMLLAVMHDDPPRPRRLQPRIPRDLEIICLKCLHKDPLKRYASAQELAVDLRRYLANEPISARPIGAWERGGKWARRHPTLAAVLAVSLLALAGLVIFGVWYHLQLQAAHAEAKEQLVHLTVAGGTRQTDGEDLLAALPWFAQALALDQGKPEREAMHRLRLGATIRLCPMPHRIWFHDERVSVAAFSPDGRQVLTASEDGTARVWDLATGAPISPALSHAKSIRHGTFSPDGRRVATASLDETARIWDAATGALVTGPLPHHGPVNWTSFDAQGRFLVTASGGKDPFLHIWDADKGTSVLSRKHPSAVTMATFSPDGRFVAAVCGQNAAWLWELGIRGAEPRRLAHQDLVVHAAFSPDSAWVVTCSADSTAQVWDTATGQPIGPMLEHNGAVNFAQFSPDGRRLATASDDNAARIWEAQTGRLMTQTLRHSSSVNQVVYRGDGRFVATIANDNTSRLWDTHTGEALTPPLRHNGSLSSVAFSPRLEDWWLLTASSDGTARLWTLPDDHQRELPIKHERGLTRVALSRDGRKVLTASKDHTARVWEAETGKALTSPLRHRGPVDFAAFSPDERLIVTASADGAARVWDAATGQAVTGRLEHLEAVRHAAFSPDNRLVATASADRTVQIFDIATGEQKEIVRLEGPANFVVFTSDGRQILTAGDDGSARLWDVATGKEVGQPFRHQDAIFQAQFSPDGRRLVTASADRTAQVWDVATRQPVGQPLRHSSKVFHAAFSMDGKKVVTAADDNTARIWDAATGKMLTPPLRHNGQVYRAVFRPDNRCVLTCCDDGTARLWDAQTGEPVSPPLRHGVSVPDAVFTPDGQRVLTASADGTARFWDLTPDARPTACLQLLAHLLGGGRIENSGLTPLQAKELKALWETYQASYHGQKASR